MLDILQKTAAEWLNISLTEHQLHQFQQYYDELVDWNSRFNLTAITDYRAVQTRHFLDSLTLADPRLCGGNSLNLDTARVIDIGAGAGFPGLPLKILYPDLQLTLVDSVGKKTVFLEHLVETLKLTHVVVLKGRAEELGRARQHRERYDLATGRAVAAWSVLAEYCLPLCRVGGLFIAPKKGDLSVELQAAATVAKTLGAQMQPTPTFELPEDTGGLRCLVVARKTGPTPALYPRRTGLPAQEPLG